MSHFVFFWFDHPPPMSFIKKWPTLTVKINYFNILYLCPSGDDLWSECFDKTRKYQRMHEEFFMYMNLCGNLTILKQLCKKFLGSVTSLFGVTPSPHVTLCQDFSLTPSPLGEWHTFCMAPRASTIFSRGGRAHKGGGRHPCSTSYCHHRPYFSYTYRVGAVHLSWKSTLVWHFEKYCHIWIRHIARALLRRNVLPVYTVIILSPATSLSSSK